jgi:integrase
MSVLMLPAAPAVLALPAPAPDPVAERARAYAQAAKAPATRRAYRADWADFSAWCAGRGVAALPATPKTVGLYLAARAGSHRPATLARRLSAIAKAHQAQGLRSPASLEHPQVGETLKGIRRVHGTAQRQKRALRTADLLQVLAHLDAGLLGVRDRALLLVGFAGALRRAELAALTYEDLAWEPEGVVVTLRYSKTDQEGKGRKVVLPRGGHAASCPVGALKVWLTAAGITTGPLFRAVDRHGRVRPAGLHRDSVGAILKRALARAGFTAAEFGGHSLRAGFATQAASNGATVFDIMRQTGHTSVESVARYVREAQLFRDAPASKLGL